MPLQVWTHPIVLAGSVASFTVGAINIATAAFLPPYIQGVMGRDPIVAGYVVAAPLIIWAFGSTVGGRLMLRTSYRFTTTIGSAIIVCGAFDADHPDARARAGMGGDRHVADRPWHGLLPEHIFRPSQSSVGREQRGYRNRLSLFARTLGQSLGTRSSAASSISASPIPSAPTPSTRLWIRRCAAICPPTASRR